MPYPINIILLAVAFLIGSFPGVANEIVALSFGGLALLNETLRFIVLRSPSPSEYEIPGGPVRRRRTPIVAPEDAP